MILTLEERLAVVAEIDRSLRGVFVDRGARGVLLRNARNALAAHVCVGCYHYRASNANGTKQELCAKVSYKLPDGTTSNVIDGNGSCWLWEHPLQLRDLRIDEDKGIIAWYDASGGWYDDEDGKYELRLAEIVGAKLGYPITVRCVSDGNGHINWRFERLPC